MDTAEVYLVRLKHRASSGLFQYSQKKIILPGCRDQAVVSSTTKKEIYSRNDTQQQCGITKLLRTMNHFIVTKDKGSIVTDIRK